MGKKGLPNRTSGLEVKWEAGVNPARSRHCKWGMKPHRPLVVKTGKERWSIDP